MSTEQERELAAVAEAIWDDPNMTWEQVQAHATATGPYADVDQGIAISKDEVKRTLEKAKKAIATVNAVRAEQASAGDREAVERYGAAREQAGYADALNCVYEFEKQSSEADEAEDAVLARMQRPVIAVTDAMVEQAFAEMKDWLPLGATVSAPTVNGMATGPDSEFGKAMIATMKANVRAALEAALRQEDKQ